MPVLGVFFGSDARSIGLGSKTVPIKKSLLRRDFFPMESLSARKTFLFPKGACPFNIQIRVQCKGDSNFKCLASIYLNGAILMQRQGQNGRHRLKKVV